jgi:hypothetical protein
MTRNIEGDDFTFSEEEYRAYLISERKAYTWTLVNYGNYSEDDAEKTAMDFYRDDPRTELIFHDSAWHWAMLKIFGNNYWNNRPDLLDPPAAYIKLFG